jgi:hypothetical protein
MVAYSFKQRFIAPILAGLGDPIQVTREWPKRQTIRAYRRNGHVGLRGEMQLYYGMRTRQCRLIGRAICIGRSDITIDFLKQTICVESEIAEPEYVKDLDAFAREDGFADWPDMLGFWGEEHGFLTFKGLLIHWEPMDGESKTPRIKAAASRRADREA